MWEWKQRRRSKGNRISRDFLSGFANKRKFGTAFAFSEPYGEPVCAFMEFVDKRHISYYYFYSYDSNQDRNFYVEVVMGSGTEMKCPVFTARTQRGNGYDANS